MRQDRGVTAPATPLPLAVVMISRDEAHNLDAAAANLAGFAAEVWLLDSYSTDDTVARALGHGFKVWQRRFAGFGDQWNFAINRLPITQPWTMKLDPDERVGDTLKAQIAELVAADRAEGFTVPIRLWFMRRPLGARLRLLRGWRTGTAEFSGVAVNEHASVQGRIVDLTGDIEHHDSPNLDHWFAKQNRYTTAEAQGFLDGSALGARPRLLGSALERRMWLKRNRSRLPGNAFAYTLYAFFALGGWRGGRTGWTWARLRGLVFAMIDWKAAEMRALGAYRSPPQPLGPAHPGAIQAKD